MSEIDCVSIHHNYGVLSYHYLLQSIGVLNLAIIILCLALNLSWIYLIIWF